jgi:CheY-like chemotaxis protein
MKPLSILLIDDDEIERIKFERVCKKNNLSHSISVANNGEKALELLKKMSDLPNIIILDLNMPKMNGFEFLRAFKNEESLKHIPTVIMSTSGSYEDVKECYSIGIAGYLIKPLHFKDYSEKVISLLNYWSKNELISN